MKKLLIVSAAAAALLFSACSTTTSTEPEANAATTTVAPATESVTKTAVQSTAALTDAVTKAGGQVVAENGTVKVTLPNAKTFLAGSKLSTKAKTALKSVAEAAKAGNSTVTVASYTDNYGSANTNKKLSTVRANAVCAYLVKEGVNVTEAIGGGASNFIDENGKSKENRRVEIVIK